MEAAFVSVIPLPLVTGTRTSYAETSTRLREAAGDQLPTGDLTPEVYETMMARWDDKASGRRAAGPSG
jgi:hypothetical protein